MARLNNNEKTPPIAWAALATLGLILSVTILTGIAFGTNTGVRAGVVTAAISIIAFTVRYFVAPPGLTWPLHSRLQNFVDVGRASEF